MVLPELLFYSLFLYSTDFSRLTPAVVALIIVEMSIFKHLGSGPIWNTAIDQIQENCRKYWWSSLIYIQNYYNYENLVSKYFGNIERYGTSTVILCTNVLI